jgi:hypothetical protein
MIKNIYFAVIISVLIFIAAGCTQNSDPAQDFAVPENIIMSYRLEGSYMDYKYFQVDITKKGRCRIAYCEMEDQPPESATPPAVSPPEKQTAYDDYSDLFSSAPDFSEPEPETAKQPAVPAPSNPNIQKKQEKVLYTLVLLSVVNEMSRLFNELNFFNFTPEDLNKDKITIKDVGTTTLFYQADGKSRKLVYGFIRDKTLAKLTGMFWNTAEQTIKRANRFKQAEPEGALPR